jgi:ATP:ADP antiporter, AAA family
MLNFLSNNKKSLWHIKPEFRSKVFLLSTTFMLMSSCLVIWRPLKMAVFSKMVGAECIPDAKLLSLFIIIPLILVYSKLVDWLRRHHLLYFFTIGHGIGGIIFYFLLSDPIAGVANTQTDSSRYLGWLFYFFMESFDAFFSTSFWSFADSVNNPNDAKYYYGFFVSGSKTGGILAAGTLYLLLTTTTIADNVFLPNTLIIGSVMLFCAAVVISVLIKVVPEDKMHGYEAVYKLEQLKKFSKKKSLNFYNMIKSSFDGLFIMIKIPYVLGIFLLVAFMEIIIVIFDYQVAIQANSVHTTAGSLTAFYALYYFLFNFFGLIISAFITTPTLRILGLRLSLFVFPCVVLTLLVIALMFPFIWVIYAALVGLRAFHYAFNHPTREALYIPTTKDVKFKAKTWTDAFGSRIAKSSGSVINKTLRAVEPSLALSLSIGLGILLTSGWFVIIYFLGRTLQNAVETKSVIGEPSPNDE